MNNQVNNDAEEMKSTIIEIHIRLGILVPIPPLEVCAELNKEWSVWLFEDKQLNIDASGNDEDELREAIRIEMDVLWRVYAMADNSTLDSGALAVKNALRQRFRFVGIM